MNLALLPTNLVQKIWQTAEHFPDRTALVFSAQKEKISFGVLVQEANFHRHSLRQQGLKKGDRVLVLMPPQKTLFIYLLALFAEGLVPILLDPRLPRSQWQLALKEAQPQATLMPLSLRLLLGLQIFWNPPRFILLKKFNPQKYFDLPPVPINPTDESLVTLTSGTTGQAKMIVRNHAVLGAQQNLACALLPPLSKDLHLAGYPVSVLQSLVEGATTYPVATKNLTIALSLLKSQSITRLSGPPGFIANLVEKLISQQQVLPTVENVLLGGAPLPDWLLRKIYLTFPNAQVKVIYGATEAEPIAFTEAIDCFSELRPGYLVGTLLPEITLIKKPFPLKQEAQAFEVVLQGPHIAGNGPHSTGDIAVFTDDHKLRLLGRKSEAFQGPEGLMLPGYLESLLEKKIPQVRRTAILFHHDTLFVFVETFSKTLPSQDLETQIKKNIELHWSGPLQIRRLKEIPVDRRHQWKIDKIKLRTTQIDD